MSNEEITYEQVMEYCKKRCLDLIDHEFLVRLYNNREAIPVEWIKRYASKKSADDEMDCYWHFWEEDVLKMIDEWEEENATID